MKLKFSGTAESLNEYVESFDFPSFSLSSSQINNDNGWCDIAIVFYEDSSFKTSKIILDLLEWQKEEKKKVVSLFEIMFNIYSEENGDVWQVNIEEIVEVDFSHRVSRLRGEPTQVRMVLHPNWCNLVKK